MKKSVILTIGVIFIIAIVVPGFIGLRMRVYNETRYVEEIICITEGYTKYDPSKPDEKPKIDQGIEGYIIEQFTPGLKVVIKCQLKPDNATNQKLEYAYDEKSRVFSVTENADGTATIEFHEKGTATIIIRATDNKKKSIEIEIYAMDNDWF